MKKIYLLLLFLGFLSCETKHQNTESTIPMISISGNQNIETVPFDSLFVKSKIIRLETTSESLLKQVGKVVLYKEGIYILDSGQEQLFQFDADGHFIRNINHKGQGPGEYVSLNDFQIKNDTIYLLDGRGGKLFAYDMADNLLFTDPIGKSRYVEVLGGGYALNIGLGHADFSTDKSYCSYMFYAKEKPVHLSAPFNKHLLGHEYVFNHGSNGFYHYNDSIFVLFPFNDTIYSLTPKGEIIPSQIIRIGDLRLSLDDSEMLLKRLLKEGISSSVFGYYKLGDYTMFSYRYANNRIQTVLVNPKGNILFDIALKSDIDHIPLLLISFDTDQKDSSILNLVPSAVILSQAKRYSDNQVLAELAEELDEDGNPLLVFYSFKGENGLR